MSEKPVLKKKVSSAQISSVPVTVNVNLLTSDGEKHSRQLVASASSLKLFQDKNTIEWSKPATTVFRFRFFIFFYFHFIALF
jgi:hypothetical protein